MRLEQPHVRVRRRLVEPVAVRLGLRAGHHLAQFAGAQSPSTTAGEHLGLEMCDVTLDRFADGEIRCKINENIRGVDVFIVQSTQPPAENLMELLILIDACFLASAERITVVIPYYGYARQDRKDQPRVPLTAKLVAKLVEAAAESAIEEASERQETSAQRSVASRSSEEDRILPPAIRRPSGDQDRAD